MKKHKQQPKGKKVICNCHGYPANRETAHIPVLWEDVWLTFRGNGKHDLRQLGPCFIGMDDIRNQIEVAKFSMDEDQKAFDGDLKRYGRQSTKEILLESIVEHANETAELVLKLSHLEAGEIVFEANDKHTPNIPIIYLPVDRLNRKDLEEGIRFYLDHLGFKTPPRLKWERTSVVVWGC